MPYTQVFLPKNNCYTSGGRGAARYHFTGFQGDKCNDEACHECKELQELFTELCEVDSKYRQEWMKLRGRSLRVPQRRLLHAEYRRKRGSRF